MLLTELAARLASQSLVTAGYTVVTGPLPASPDKVISLRETGGAGPEIAFGGAIVEQPGLQVVVRGEPNDYAAPRAALETVHQGILSWGAFVQSGTRYLGLTALQAPFALRMDTNDRHELAVNYLVQKEPSV